MKYLWASFLIIFLIGCTTAERGDVLQVTYTGAYTNGTVFDTNDPHNAGVVPAQVSHFTPLQVTLGRGQVVPGFEQALYGMRKGQTKEVTIKAKDAYGTYDAQRLVSVPKSFFVPQTVTLERTVPVPKEAIDGSIAAGRIIETRNFRYNITGANATHVFLYMINATADPIVFDQTYWNSTLARATPQEFVYKPLIDNRTYLTDMGPYVPVWNGSGYLFTTAFRTGQQYRSAGGIGRVTRESDDMVYVDFNHPLAGMDLLFNVTVDSIDRPK